jgi:hypothetical protein
LVCWLAQNGDSDHGRKSSGPQADIR